MNGYSRGATEKKSTNSKLMFSSVCNARGRCGWCFIPNWVAAHFLAFQVADSSEWQVELFARNSASQTARARYAHTDTHTHARFCFFLGQSKGRDHTQSSLLQISYEAEFTRSYSSVSEASVWRDRDILGSHLIEKLSTILVPSNLTPLAEDDIEDCWDEFLRWVWGSFDDNCAF